MKRTFSIGIISLLLIIGLVITSCGGGGSPSNVIRKLHTAVEKGDTKVISELVVPEAAALILKMMEQLQEAYTESGGIAKIEETIDGNTAVVTVTYKMGDTADYDLVKVNGKWKGTIDKH